MKKKYLLSLLIPLALVSCSPKGVGFTAMKNFIDNNEDITDEELFPYYHVDGMIDYAGVVTPVDMTFDQNPSDTKLVPRARYNEGFYNPSVDTSEDEENVIIYGLSSRSYFLRAPLRITKSNFYDTIAKDVGTGSFDKAAITINFIDGRIGSIGEKISNAMIEFKNPEDLNTLTMTYEEEGTPVELTLIRQGSVVSQRCLFRGTFADGSHKLVLNQDEKENTTCANAILRSIITSYAGQPSSTNPSNNQMVYEINSDGSFSFVGYGVHTDVRIDNYPYYPDPEFHPEIEWDEENPLPCYKSNVNAKVNIRFDYNKYGWLVKESMTSIGYNYNISSDSQVSLVSVYTYKFGE